MEPSAATADAAADTPPIPADPETIAYWARVYAAARGTQKDSTHFWYGCDVAVVRSALGQKGLPDEVIDRILAMTVECRPQKEVVDQIRAMALSCIAAITMAGGEPLRFST